MSKIFVMGDIAEDLILVPQNKYIDVNRKSNYDLFTRDLITSYRSQSGCMTLGELLRACGDFEVCESKNSETSLETISEWKSIGSRLYLTNHIGLINEGMRDNIIPLASEDLINMKSSDIVAIYNMSNTFFCNKEQLQSIGETAIILLRTKFENNRQPSNFLKMLGEAKLCQQTILLFNVNELRRAGFNINKGVSWEQLLIETMKSIKMIPDYNEYMYIIVCFNHEGCLIYSKDVQKLVFYPGEIEGDYVIKNDKKVFGPIICMQAYIAKKIMETPKWKSIDKLRPYMLEIVKSGLAVMRELIKLGYDEKAHYPTSELAELFNDSSKMQLPESIDVPTNDSNDYTIIDKENNKMLNIGRDIVRYGHTQSITPFLRYNNLLTYDRFEIEQFRNVYNLLDTYCVNNNMSKPLSICVFGPPGSGKSFAVKQIVDAIDRDECTSKLEYNLSQMTSLNDLSSAFHVIRDEGLKGRLPIAFFDEFDSKFNGDKLGWLKYFLAPMQDGEFCDFAKTHFIGKSVFVFAGGTCTTLKEFKNKAESSDGIDNKVNDFLSRIRGYINIYGPNRKKCQNKVYGVSSEECRKQAERYQLIKSTQSRPSHEFKEIDACQDKFKYCWDTAFYLRRATLLRGLLECKLGKNPRDEIEIDSKVLDAFLRVDEYLHGARSLEAIVQMSDVIPGYIYNASCINSNGLELYVDESFNELLTCM